MPQPLLLHASAVAVEGRALLILGPSGCGKSSLALQMMALGARLVADDRVELTAEGAEIVAQCPAPIAGLIEARGIGLLRAEPLARATVAVAVDLAACEGPRMPEPQVIVILDRRIDLVRVPLRAHVPAALISYLRSGRAA